MPFRSVIIDNDGVNRGLQAHRDLKVQSVETQSGQSRFFPVFSGETGDTYLGKKPSNNKKKIPFPQAWIFFCLRYCYSTAQ